MIVNNQQKNKRGAFIVFEGVDRCGKSTQCRLLLKNLVSSLGVAAMGMNFPNRSTPIGHLINDYLTSGSSLDDHSIHLLFSANRWEVANNPQKGVGLLTALLDEGTTVVCDRYAYSGICFTHAKQLLKTKQEQEQEDSSSGATSGITMDWCKSPDVGLPRPDCVFYLDLSPEQASKRGGYGEERYEKRDLQICVRECFEDLIDEDNNDASNNDNDKLWHVVDASQSVDALEKQILEKTREVLRDIHDHDKPLQKLWTHGTYTTTTTTKTTPETTTSPSSPPPLSTITNNSTNDASNTTKHNNQKHNKNENPSEEENA